jgi:hypothetical protein
VNTFIVDLKNKPGELAKVTEAIAEKGIDITAFSGSTCGDSGSLALVTNDETGTNRVLSQGQWKFHTIELVETSLANRPGSLAEVTRRLTKAGVNIEAAFPIGMSGNNVQVAFATDNPVKAKQAVAELVGASAR